VETGDVILMEVVMEVGTEELAMMVMVGCDYEATTTTVEEEVGAVTTEVRANDGVSGEDVIYGDEDSIELVWSHRMWEIKVVSLEEVDKITKRVC
jgi:hypothetical protein